MAHEITLAAAHEKAYQAEVILMMLSRQVEDMAPCEIEVAINMAKDLSSCVTAWLSEEESLRGEHQ
jgi:hypothetical protein